MLTYYDCGWGACTNGSQTLPVQSCNSLFPHVTLLILSKLNFDFDSILQFRPRMTLKVGLKYVRDTYTWVIGHGSIIYSKEPPLNNFYYFETLVSIVLRSVLSIVLRSVLIMWRLFYISSLYFAWSLFFPLHTVVILSRHYVDSILSIETKICINDL